jgi:anti-sigma regulatory factor (Ser/Thr protein kinase)
MEMTEQLVTIDFPGDIEYIPDIRRFLANLISLRSFSRRFSFRMEIIVDELCNNAIKFGNLRVGEFVTITCRVRDNEVVMEVCNPGSDEKEVRNLKKAVAAVSAESDASADFVMGRGVQIIKILSNSVQVLENNGTVVRVVKKKIENEDL